MRLTLLIFLILFVSCSKKEKNTKDINTSQKPAEAVSSEKKTEDDDFVKLKGEVTYSLDDAEELHRQFPDTYEIPDKKIRENLKAGDIVKLVFIITDGVNSLTERMWVIVNELNSEGYSGTLNNAPFCTDKIKAGQTVKFSARHVISIYSKK